MTHVPSSWTSPASRARLFAHPPVSNLVNNPEAAGRRCLRTCATRAWLTPPPIERIEKFEACTLHGIDQIE